MKFNKLSLDYLCLILGILSFISSLIFILPFFIDITPTYSNIITYIFSRILFVSTPLIYIIGIIGIIRNAKKVRGYKLNLIIIGMILGIIPLLFLLILIFILISTKGKGLWIH